MMKNTWFALCILGILSGCGHSVSKVSFVNPAIPSATSFSFVDARPDSERSTQKINSGQIMLHRLGDDYVSPSASELLRAALTLQPQAELQGQIITVKSIRVIVESPDSGAGNFDPERFSSRRDAAMQQTASVGYGGAMAGAILVDLLERAFEKANDNTIHTVKVYIDGEIGQQVFSEYAFSSYDTGNGEEQIKEALSEAIDKTAHTVLRLARSK